MACAAPLASASRGSHSDCDLQLLRSASYTNSLRSLYTAPVKTKDWLRPSRWALALCFLLLLLSFCFVWYVKRSCDQLYCISYMDSPGSQCADGTRHPMMQRLSLSDSAELVIENVQVIRGQSTLTALVKLKGRFWNATDQNVYAFIGQPLPDGVSASYALSSDPQYFSDLSYPVRATIQLPHTVDIRVGVMAPQEAAYTPQVYINDPVRADAVGSASHIGVKIDGQLVRIEFPLDEFYRRKGTVVPQSVGITIATARDYVGFIDQVSTNGIAVGETKTDSRRPLPPTAYPSLDYNSHTLKRLSFAQSNGTLRVELETQSPIEDWGQTNLHFFFIAYPPEHTQAAPNDPSKTIVLPYPWLFYCGVYSPHRLTCKASHGTDFTYDSGYSERSNLESPTGTQFRTLGGAKYSLELAPEAVKTMTGGSGQALALLVTIGRDGFGPSSCYGWDCSGMCRLFHRLSRASKSN